MTRLAFPVVVAVAAAILAGGAGAARPTQATLITRVNVVASEFAFKLDKKTASRGVVIFKITNAGALPHNFTIQNRKTRLLQHGESETLRVTFLRKGSYKYLCTVTGHAAAGMTGVFTIT